MAMTRSNDPSTKNTLTIVLRKSERAGVPPALTRATRRKKRPSQLMAWRVREEKSRLELTLQHRNDHDRPYDGIAKSAKDAIGDRAQNKIVTGNFMHGEDIQGHKIQE